MRKLDLSVHIVNTKLNHSALLIGKRVHSSMPCLGRTEADVEASGPQFVTVEDSMSMVHASKGNLPPASTFLRSEPAIVAGIAVATLPTRRRSTGIIWSGITTEIRDAIEAVFPDDFKDYNKRIRVPGGFRLPLPATERVWSTPSGKAEFLVYEGLNENSEAANGVFRLTTLRSHDQYNTTVYGLDDRYRGVFGRRDVLFMSKADMAAQNLEHGDIVDIETALPGCERNRVEGFTVIAYEIARGSVGAYYPETNPLIPLTYNDAVSGTPSYKSVPVRITRRAA